MVKITLSATAPNGGTLIKEFPTANKIEKQGEDIQVFHDSFLVAIFKGHSIIGAEIVEANANAQAA